MCAHETMIVLTLTCQLVATILHIEHGNNATISNGTAKFQSDKML